MTKRQMIAVVKEMEQRGSGDLLAYLSAFHIAVAVMGESMGRPIKVKRSERERNAILIAICLAAHVREDSRHDTLRLARSPRSPKLFTPCAAD